MTSENLRTALESLSRKIEKNTANINDYNSYENLLVQSGFHSDYIHAYLRQAGFDSWDDFVRVRGKKQIEANTLGTILGFGLGIMFLWALSEKK